MALSSKSVELERNRAWSTLILETLVSFEPDVFSLSLPLLHIGELNMFDSFLPFRSRPVANWESIEVLEGKPWKGFKAGPVIGVPTHYFDNTVGCRKALTRGALPCACDTMPIETRWRGYLPMWDLAGVRWVVILGERYGRQAMTIGNLKQLIVSRAPERGNPIRAVEQLWTVEQPPLNKAEKLPQDIRRWMLRVWSDSQLSQWFEENPMEALPADAPRAYTRTATQEEAKLKDMIQSRINCPNPRDANLPATFEEAMNGTHKKKKGSR